MKLNNQNLTLDFYHGCMLLAAAIILYCGISPLFLIFVAWSNSMATTVLALIATFSVIALALAYILDKAVANNQIEVRVPACAIVAATCFVIVAHVIWTQNVAWSQLQICLLSVPMFLTLAGLYLGFRPQKPVAATAN